jgi:hypothetical protein
VDETLTAERERARLRRVVDQARQGLRGTTEAPVARPDTGWAMSADGVIGAPAEGDE